MPTRRQSSPWGQLAWQVVEVFVAETVGTAMLLFFGCMGLVSWSPEGTLPPLQGATVFAVVVTTIIQIFGHISAAHLNPAVTIAFWVLGHVSPVMVVVYLVAECCGRSSVEADIIKHAGQYTGASMNPARSLAPALWTGTWDSHWIYWLGPCLGGFFTAIFYQALFQKQVTNPSQKEVPLNQVKVATQTKQ